VTPGLEKSHGWWNRIVAGDFTGDGKVDFIIGNLGLNTRLQASESEPATMHVKDFDKNGFDEQIISYYNQGRSYPLPLRDDLIKSLPFLKARYLNYEKYARQSITDSRRTRWRRRWRETTATAHSRWSHCRAKRSSRRCTAF